MRNVRVTSSFDFGGCSMTNKNRFTTPLDNDALFPPGIEDKSISTWAIARTSPDADKEDKKFITVDLAAMALATPALQPLNK